MRFEIVRGVEHAIGAGREDLEASGVAAHDERVAPWILESQVYAVLRELIETRRTRLAAVVAPPVKTGE